jgi:hypothetical protein
LGCGALDNGSPDFGKRMLSWPARYQESWFCKSSLYLAEPQVLVVMLVAA